MTAENNGTPDKGVSLNKSDQVRQLYTGAIRVAYDSRERREAITKYLESKGVSKELQAVRMIMELGQGRPAGVPPQGRRGLEVTRSAEQARELDNRGRDLGRDW